MANKKRNPLKVIGVGISPQLHLELADLCWALDRPVSEIAREMIENDLSRFKDRHRDAIRKGKKDTDSLSYPHPLDSE